MTRVEIETPEGPAWADVDRPGGDAVGVFFVGHGAGGGVDHVDIRAACDGALAAGYVAVRVTQPYRVAGRRVPPAAPRLDEAWLTVTSAVLDQVGPLPAVHGGRSSGARVACRTAASTGAVAVVALAFPLLTRRLPRSSSATSVVRVRYPDGHGLLRTILQIATAQDFVIEEVSTERGKPSTTIIVTLHVHGPASVNELAVALSEVPDVEAVVSDDINAAGD